MKAPTPQSACACRAGLHLDPTRRADAADPRVALDSADANDASDPASDAADANPESSSSAVLRPAGGGDAPSTPTSVLDPPDVVASFNKLMDARISATRAAAVRMGDLFPEAA